jgi:hypothetical protein
VAMVPLASLAALIAMGIGVDFSGQVRAEQELRDVASQCARVGAGQVSVGGAPGPGSALSAAQSCLVALGVEGTVSVTGSSLGVSLRGQYSTAILGIIGIADLPLKAEAAATIREGQ